MRAYVSYLYPVHSLSPETMEIQPSMIRTAQLGRPAAEYPSHLSAMWQTGNF